MMSAAPTNVGPHDLVLFFETNRPIPASAVAVVLQAVEELALQPGYLGSDGLLEVAELQTGTMWVRFTTVVGVLGSLAGIGSLANDIAGAIKSPTAPIAHCVAGLVEHHGVVSTRVISCEGGIEILPPMMATVVNRRAAENGTDRDENHRSDAEAVEQERSMVPNPFEIGEPLPSYSVAPDPTDEEVRRTHSSYPVSTAPEIAVLEISSSRKPHTPGPIHRLRGRFVDDEDARTFFEDADTKQRNDVRFDGPRPFDFPLNQEIEIVGPMSHRPIEGGRFLIPITHFYPVGRP
jgi:hypothetical protein